MKVPAGRWLWLWLLVFLFPLSVVAGRFCWFGPTDDAYHGLVALHRVLPQLVLAAALLSIATVLVRVWLVRDRLNMLSALSSHPPEPLVDAFVIEAGRLGVVVPHLVYVSAAAPLCFTGFGFRRSEVFISRGFIRDLDAMELRLVAHHEIVHVRKRHAAWNFFWHVVFSALVLPGFDGIERALRLRREAQANVSAAEVAPAVYERLLLRRARERQTLCFEGQSERRPNGFSLLAAPAAVVLFFIALSVSHADFMHDLPYLVTHHC